MLGLNLQVQTQSCREVIKLGKITIQNILMPQILQKNPNRKSTNIKYQRLSRTQIQFLIYLHTGSIDSNGIIKRFNISLAAKELDCSIKSVQNNLRLFTRLRYICTSSLGNGRVSIFFPDYKKYHLTAREGGQGYIPVTKSFIGKILKSKNVNSIRVALVQLLKVDEDRLVLEKEAVNRGLEKPNDTLEVESNLPVTKIKRHIPKYLNSSKQVKTLICNDLFITGNPSEDSKCSFKIKDNYVKQAQEVKDKYDSLIRGEASNEDIDLELDQIHDIRNLCMQYGDQLVTKAFKVLKRYIGYKNVGYESSNYASFMRRTIQKLIATI